MREILKGLTEHQAETDPRALDARLRGRTYAIAFESVWQASVGLVSGGLAGWTMVNADDQQGRIDARWQRRIPPAESDVRIHIGLDRNAQTRVDVHVHSRQKFGDLGRSRRMVTRFLKSLDQRLGADARLILDPSDSDAWEMES